MKHFPLILLIGSIISLTSTSCDKPKSESTEVETDATEEWKEMDSFHMIMAEAFHPYKDSSNLAPVKKLAEEIAAEADNWASATLPEKVNSEAIKQDLKKLRTDSRSLAELIKSGADDAAIGLALDSLHDSFHSIMEAWHSGSEEHEHSH